MSALGTPLRTTGTLRRRGTASQVCLDPGRLLGPRTPVLCDQGRRTPFCRTDPLGVDSLRPRLPTESPGDRRESGPGRRPPPPETAPRGRRFRVHPYLRVQAQRRTRTTHSAHLSEPRARFVPVSRPTPPRRPPTCDSPWSTPNHPSLLLVRCGRGGTESKDQGCLRKDSVTSLQGDLTQVRAVSPVLAPTNLGRRFDHRSRLGKGEEAQGRGCRHFTRLIFGDEPGAPRLTPVTHPAPRAPPGPDPSPVPRRGDHNAYN